MEAPQKSTPRRHMIISSFPHYIYTIPSTATATATATATITSADNDDDYGDQCDNFREYFIENIDLSSPPVLMNGTSLLPLPPRLQSSTSSPISCSRGSKGYLPANKCRKLLSSVATSLPSSLMSFRNKGAFDPFIAAVENIRKQDMHDELMQQEQPLGNALSKNKYSSNKLARRKIKLFDQSLNSKMIGIIKNKVVLTINNNNRSGSSGLRWESLARCVSSAHPTTLTAWFGSAKKPPQGCNLNY